MTATISRGSTAPIHGLGAALLSAAAFGTSGTFATSLLGAGWSPAAAVTARLLIAAAALTVPAMSVMRGRWSELAGAYQPILAYGVVAVAASQLCYFNAVEHLSVGIALLLEYLGTVLIVGWQWLRHGQRPRRLTIIGIAIVITGLAFVLDITGPLHVDVVGVLWGIGAAVGLAGFFVLSAGTDDRVPPVAMAWSGMTIGGLCLLGLGITHLMTLHASTHDVAFAHHRISWLVPVLGLSLIAAALAYATGIRAARTLGAKLASFVGLSEVLFACLFAWLVLGQQLQSGQIGGGVLVLVGIAFVRADEDRSASDGIVDGQATCLVSQPAYGP
jgi:drug/metabolite transporter (DMT)-like permease